VGAVNDSEECFDQEISFMNLKLYPQFLQRKHDLDLFDI
jgi:hypothetical protein